MTKEELSVTAGAAEDRKAQLLLLAERCEREKPNLNLDADIVKALDLIGQALACIDEPIIPNYTSSLDAAVTLVPKGWRVQDITQVPTDKLEWNVTLERNPLGRATSQARTEPMALCAAALRALAHEASTTKDRG